MKTVEEILQEYEDGVKQSVERYRQQQLRALNRIYIAAAIALIVSSVIIAAIAGWMDKPHCP